MSKKHPTVIAPDRIHYTTEANLASSSKKRKKAKEMAVSCDCTRLVQLMYRDNLEMAYRLGKLEAMAQQATPQMWSLCSMKQRRSTSMNELFHVTDRGLTYDGTLISPFVPEIDQIYYLPSGPISNPSALDLSFRFEGGFPLRARVGLEDLSYRRLHTLEPMISSPNAKTRALFDEYLSELLREAVLSLPSKENAGIYIDHLGWNLLPNGARVFAYGNRLVGTCSQAFCISPELPELESGHQGSTFPILVDALEKSSNVVTQLAGYIMLTTLRSPVLESGCSLQGVAYVYGTHGSGKTTLVQRMAAFTKSPGSTRAVNFFDASSTSAALRDAMVLFRDLPVIIDDLCYSSGRQTAQRRIETAALLIREASNDTLITKKDPTGRNITFYCGAGGIITAEFKLQNESDIERCIFYPIFKTPKIDERIQPELVQESCLELAEWFIENQDEALQELRTRIDLCKQSPSTSEIGFRIATNYCAMEWALDCFLKAAKSKGCPEDQLHVVRQKFQKAVKNALQAQLEALDAIQKSRPIGNLSYLLYEAYDEGLLRMAKKIEKLKDKDGIIWKEDFCLRKASLENYIRKQPGYQAYTATKIARELSDIGALIVNENDSYQVKLAAGAPRVYRINLKVLKETAKEYVSPRQC